MSMDAAVEKINQQMADLTALVQSHKATGDTATLDVDKLIAVVKEAADSQVSARLAEVERNRPVYKGELVGPPGFRVPSRGVVEKGRFAGQQVDDLVFVNNFLRRAAGMGGGKVRLPSAELTQIVQNALGPTTVGGGDEWVPTEMAASIWSDAFLASKVVGSLPHVAMTSNPYDSPLLTIGTWRKGSANTAASQGDPTTASSRLTVTEQVLPFAWSYDLDEDGVIAELPTWRAEVTRSAAEQMDAFALNADSTDAATGNINLDDSNPPDDSYYLSDGQDGIRHLYIVDNTNQSADVSTTLTDALLRTGIGKLGKYGAMVDRLVMVTNPKTYVLSMLGLTNVATIDKFGPKATILTGELMKYAGISVIASESMALAEDDGKVSATGANNDEGQIAIFHRDMWRVGFMRELLIEVDRDIQKRQFIMVASFRMAIGCRGTRSSATHTAGVHGISY